MKGLNFHAQKPVAASAPNRMDVACFVGLVEVRSGPSSAEIDRWLYQQGWMNSEQGYKATYHRESAAAYLDVPVPLESWERFDSLFAWNQRVFNEGVTGTSYLGAAVRSFFAQGGRKCYVIRAGNPLPLSASNEEREQAIAKLIPGFPGLVNVSKADRATWHGIGHLFGLPDVSFLCMPDLPDLVQAEVVRVATDTPESPGLPEQFVECSDSTAAESEDHSVATIPAPRADEPGYRNWSKAIRQTARFIAENFREVQLLASIPLPAGSTPAYRNLLNFMHQQAWLSGSLDSNDSIASAFVQLCYPWVVTAGSGQMPERLEPAEGAVIGMLARNALTRGSYRSVTKLQQHDISAIFPQLSQSRIYAKNAKAPLQASPNAGLIDRVSLLGQKADGIGILSDVTTSNQTAHRPANVNRIISLLIRATRRAGEDFVFESNGDALWAELKQRINDLLLHLFNLGALRGRQPEEAFFVRCDRSTMTQQDIDNGRVIAEIHFEPAASIESIDVFLIMNQSGQIVGTATGNEAAA